MSRPTPPSPASSTASGAKLRLAPERSRLLALWWCAVHLAAAGGVVLPGLPLAARAAGVAVLLAHAIAFRPRRPPLLLERPDGLWSCPDRAREPLRLDAATAYGAWWVKLVLAAPGAQKRRPVAVLLLRDQLPAEAWRALQAELRRDPAGRDEGSPDFS